MDPEEQDAFRQMETNLILQAEQEIQLFNIRERRMLRRLQDLKDGLGDKQRRVLQERQAVKKVIPVYDETTGQNKVITTSNHELVVANTEETEYRIIDDIYYTEFVFK